MSRLPDVTAAACAVVVGACGHGIMLARALRLAGVRVVMLESNRELPGCSTAYADLHFVDDINGHGLVDALLAWRPPVDVASERPVLILTNDRMVATVAEHVDLLCPHFRISWATGAERTRHLLRKSAIEEQCRRTGLNYPRTVQISRPDQLDGLPEQLDLPVIFKPVAPVSAFKTIVVADWNDLPALVPTLQACMPVIAQDFIAGGDESIAFGAIYLHEGAVVARFEGEKIRSRPMGHTTIARSLPSDEVHGLAAQFFGGLNLSGPVSLELKRDPRGRYWVIEPTVGRTDYWVGLCIDNGVNFPLIEYWHQVGRPMGSVGQSKFGIWVNGERDPLALVWLLFHRPARLWGHRIAGVYADLRDPRPMLRMLAMHLRDLGGRILRKIKEKLAALTIAGRP